MWLVEHFKNQEVYGFARNSRTAFFNYVGPNTDNSLIGMTNKQKKFWISMQDDVNEKQYLRINNFIPMKSKFTTEFIEELVGEKSI